MVALDGIKKYLRIDDDDEDALLEKFLDVAGNYLRNAISDYENFYENNEKFQAQADLLTMVLVSEQFNNRDGRNDSRQDFSFVIRSMVNQLQYFVAGDSS